MFTSAIAIGGMVVALGVLLLMAVSAVLDDG